MDKTQINQHIDTLLIDLRLPSIRKHYQEQAQQSAENADSFELFLQQLLQQELESRIKNRKLNAIRQANFPYKKYLDELKVKELPVEAQEKINLLERLDFIDHGQNIIMAGNPGTGKTHLAIALGIKACMEGKKVFFTDVASLIVTIRETRSEKKLTQLQARFKKYDLVIVDEFGYISFDKQAAELLFTHLSLRAGRKSTIITTNLSFDRWNEIFGDPVLTAAMVDRLTHKAYMINMNGTSYRLKETAKWRESRKTPPKPKAE